MTQAKMIADIRALGLTVSVREGEIRVAHPKAPASAGYYTNDRHDALATAEQMAKEYARE